MMSDKNQEKKYLEEKIEEFLARGGKIQICPPCTRSEDIEYKHKFGQRGRKKKTDKE